MIDVNDRLPAIEVLDSEANPVDLSALPPPFVLYFYPKADTPGCTSEARDFSALAADFAEIGCAVYGISKDKPAKLAKFAAKYDLHVRLLSDDAGDAIEQMGMWVEKSMYGRSYMGIERATFLVGRDGKVAQMWRKVKVKGHADEVLAAARSIAGS
jgi:thioredoxin-dependent peroxiredoxin